MTAPTLWTAELNPAQLRAVTHGQGPLLVVAGAGTGKTRTLACRVAHLVASGVAPERILLLTFTRRAAREMLSRAARFRAAAGAGRVWGGTFHSVANRLLRTYGRAVGLCPAFTILDQADAADLMDVVRSELGLGAGERRFPRKDTLAAIHSRAVNAGLPLRRVLEEDFPWCAPEEDGIRAVFRAYTRRKREGAMLDFDDLLLFWKALLDAPGAGERVAGLFDHVLVDEYQDTNTLQADILAALRRTSPNLTVVGDDAQAIYSFRSATVANILGFAERFPGTTVVTLEQSYRCTGPILAAANAVMAEARHRHRKELWPERPGHRRPALVTCRDEAEQADLVCEAVLEHREEGTPLHRQAVLFRAAHHSDALEVELSRRNIPFVKYGGLRFVEAAHVKDLLAFLRVLENPRDEVSWFRLLQLLPGVGPATARAAVRALGVGPGGEGTGAASPLARLVAEPPPMPSAAATDLERLRAALGDCAAGDLPPAAQVERARRFLEPVFERVYRAAPSRCRDLEQLERLAARSPTRERFLADLTFDPPVSTGDLAGPPHLDEDYLVLSTIHSAKGCEWDVVHVIHAADGNIPSDMATGSEEGVEEERRLFYVALTRAREMLHVYAPLRYHHRKGELTDAHGYAQVTRFVTPAVRALFDERTGPAEPPEEAVAAVPAGVAAVDAFLDRLWGRDRPP